MKAIDPFKQDRPTFSRLVTVAIHCVDAFRHTVYREAKLVAHGEGNEMQAMFIFGKIIILYAKKGQ